MMKLVKFLIGLAVVVVLLIAALVLTLPIWLGPVVKPLANAAVPKITKTTFSLGALSLNPYTGRLEVGDLQLGNPEGFAEKRAVDLKNLVVDVDMATLTGKCMHIQEVTIDGFFVSYVSAKGVNNFDQIQYNVAGSKEKYEQAKAKEAAKAKKPEPEGESFADKVVIDKLVIKDVQVMMGPITLPVPSLTLTDLGKKSDGLTWEELGNEILNALMKSAGAVGAFAEDGAQLLKSGTGKTVDAVGDGAKAVGQEAGKAVDAVEDGAKAVGKEAEKAVDALKSLF